jgi:multidrug efflux system membrane fusion protein
VVEEIKAQSISLANELPGRTIAFQSSQVRPQIGGILKQRLFTEGADVKAGQVLYVVDPAPYQAVIERAEADLTSAQAEVFAARPKAERYYELVALDAMSKQDGDDALAALRQSEAAVRVAEAAVRAAKIDFDNTRIKAPISGRIGTSNYTAGALVSAEQSEALATINQLDPVYVDVVQPSAQWLALRRKVDGGEVVTVDGKPVVRLILEDGITYERSGTLEVVDAAVDKSTGSVKLRAVFLNPKHLILPGMYVKASLAMATNPQAILAPQRAITRNNKGEAVALVVGEDNKVEQRIVQTGDVLGDRWVVTNGLTVGEKIIVEGGQRARAGQTVTAVAAAATTQQGE